MPSSIAAVLTVSLADSYRHCRAVARARAKNFYYSFLLLERPRRDAMCAIYAFMRACDDLSDSPDTRKSKAEIQEAVAIWRVDLDHALNGFIESDDPIWPAFADTVSRYNIPHRFFHEMIDGIASDLEPRVIETYGELYRYCYHVASVVGLTIIHIFGFESIRALILAEKCGVAFQLTNILRDVREDAEAGRVYLPAEDLQAYGVSREQLRYGMENHRFRELMRFEASRAQGCYDDSAGLADLIHPKSRRSLWALREIYLRLLRKIEKSNYSVLSRRISLSTPVKLALLARAFLR